MEEKQGNVVLLRLTLFVCRYVDFIEYLPHFEFEIEDYTVRALGARGTDKYSKILLGLSRLLNEVSSHCCLRACYAPHIIFGSRTRWWMFSWALRLL